MNIYGYVSPEGEFEECGYQEHMWLADKIAERLNGGTLQYNAEKYLAERNWLTVNRCWVGIDNGLLPERMYITDKQIQWIMDNYDKFGNDQLKGLSMALISEELSKCNDVSEDSFAYKVMMDCQAMDN